MRKTAIALFGAMAVALGGATIPVDAYAKDKPKPTKVLVKKAEKKPARIKLVTKSKCKPGERWNATATLNAGACEKRVVSKIKVKKAPKTAAKPADKPAQIKKPS